MFVLSARRRACREWGCAQVEQIGEEPPPGADGHEGLRELPEAERSCHFFVVMNQVAGVVASSPVHVHAPS